MQRASKSTSIRAMRALLAATCLLAMACQPRSSFELTTDRTTYARGEIIELELRSNVIDAAHYNLCSVTFRPAVSRPPVACATIALGLPAFGVATGQATIPEDAAAGDYQLQTGVEVVGPGVTLTVASDTFSVVTP
jgi:hypothetical protein